MPYSAEISRTNPSCFLFLIDQSGSMADPFPEGNKRKADAVADAVNKLLENLVIKCAKEEGVRDYFHVGVIGYGATVGPAFGGALVGRSLVPLSEVASMPLRIDERNKKEDDGAGGLVERTVKFPVWFDAVAANGTPMCQALGEAKRVVQEWLSAHPACFPPIVINLTDGEATDGDPREQASAIRVLSSSDGETLLFNLHMSSRAGASVAFPPGEEGLPDEFARALFSMSSVLPAHMRDLAQQKGFTVSESSRGFVFNGGLVELIDFLEIGTRARDLR